MKSELNRFRIMELEAGTIYCKRTSYDKK